MLKHHLSQNDREFRAAFEAGAFAPADFSHRAHVMLSSLLYLAESDVNLALERMRAALVSFLSPSRDSGLEVSRHAHARVDPRGGSLHASLARSVFGR